ncbi:MAG: Sec-independent protein translocase protein TatB [Sneathiella sp.]
MFDIGWSEMVFVLVIAVLVIGPKDLPRAISTVTKYIRKARGMAREFQTGINDLARETEIDEITKGLKKDTSFNIKKQVEDAVDPTGSKDGMFNDVKPQIRDPRDSANNYSAPPAKSDPAAAAPKKEDTPAEKPATTTGTDTATDLPPEPKPAPKPETKVS